MINYKSPLFRIAIDGYLGWRFDKDVIKRIVKENATRVQADARSMLASSAGAGRVYGKPGGGQYRASSPGELPAMRTGHLAESILARFAKHGLTAWIGPRRSSFPNGDYPEFLISGRPDRGLLKRKNAVAIAGRRHRLAFNRELAAAMQKAIQPGPPA